MHVIKISRAKRITACIMGIMMLIVILSAAFFIAHEAGHDCTGEDCPICACVAECENTLHQISGGLASQTAVILPVIFLFLSLCLSAAMFMQETPVSRKDRLNN